METDTERGRRLGRKYILSGLVALACIFVALTTLEITEGVFGSGTFGMAGAAPPSALEGACSENLRGLAAAVERAIAVSSRLADGEGATSLYREALLPEWGKEGAIEARCAGEPGGANAFATVVRLRLAGEALARRQAGELGPIRQTLAAYLGH
jgi:hypothetical protein